MGTLININESNVFENATQNDLIQVLLSEIRSIDLDRSLQAGPRKQLELNPLRKSPAQLRLFAVPDGSLGISVSSSPEDSARGLQVIDVDDFTYFAPGDVISSVNGIVLSKLSPEFAVNILLQSNNRNLCVIRDMGDACNDMPQASCESSTFQDKCATEGTSSARMIPTKIGPYNTFINKMKCKFSDGTLASNLYFDHA